MLEAGCEVYVPLEASTESNALLLRGRLVCKDYREIKGWVRSEFPEERRVILNRVGSNCDQA
jgi:hypothetical protein